jgi:hypothetical protein
VSTVWGYWMLWLSRPVSALTPFRLCSGNVIYSRLAYTPPLKPNWPALNTVTVPLRFCSGLSNTSVCSSCRDKWVPVTTAWHVLRLRMNELQTWKVATNILNKQLQTADKELPPA